MMADIEQWDGHALEKLMQRGSMTVREVRESVERDPFELPIARAWLASALERGFIATTGGSDESTRYNITAAGRNAASVRTGRLSSRRSAPACPAVETGGPVGLASPPPSVSGSTVWASWPPLTGTRCGLAVSATGM